MKAKITFSIGLTVSIISIIQFISTFAYQRLIGLAIGIFVILIGWKIGWTVYRRFIALTGHIAVTAGCLAVSYGIYQVKFIESEPSLLQVLDMPLFWGLFTIFGGFCMITHSYCSCTIRMHDENKIKIRNNV